MWVEVYIDSVKAKSQAASTWGNTKKIKAEGKLDRELKNLCTLMENSAECLGSSREHCWGYVSMVIRPKSCGIFPLKVATTLLSGSRKAQSEQSGHIIQVSVEATC